MGTDTTASSMRSVRSSSSIGNRSGSALSRSASGMMGQGRDKKWSRLDEYATFLSEQDALRHREIIKGMQSKLRKDLDEQVEAVEARKRQAVVEDMEYAARQKAELESWAEIEKQRLENEKMKTFKQREERDKQLAADIEKRQAEIEKKKASEAEFVDRINQEIELERHRVMEKRAQHRKAMRTIMKENIEERRAKDEAKQVQTQQEIESMALYNDILDRQEAEREEELRRRMARQKELMDQMQSSVKAERTAAADNDAQRAAEQKAEADARTVEMERNKADKLRLMRAESQAFLFKQMAEKEEKKRQANKLKNLQAAILEADTEDYREMEARRAEERRLLNLRHRKELEQTMHERKAARTRTEQEMTDEEWRYNRQLMDVVDRTLEERDTMGF